MDTERGGVNPKDPLRSLFQEVGHVQAPTGLEQRILERMAAQPAPSLVEPPLITKPMWVLLGAAIVALVSAAFLLPLSGSDLLPSTAWMEELLRLPRLTAFISSKWTLMAGAGVLTLMLMDRMLGQRTRALFLF